MLSLTEELNHDHVYVKTALQYERPVFYIYNTDGMAIYSFTEREVAFAQARLCDLIPHSLH